MYIIYIYIWNGSKPIVRKEYLDNHVSSFCRVHKGIRNLTRCHMKDPELIMCLSTGKYVTVRPPTPQANGPKRPSRI